jgi:hypothetical protein
MVKPHSKLKGCMVLPKNDYTLKDALSKSKFEKLPLVGDFGSGGQIIYSYSGKYDPGYDKKKSYSLKLPSKRCKKV